MSTFFFLSQSAIFLINQKFSLTTTIFTCLGKEPAPDSVDGHIESLTSSCPPHGNQKLMWVEVNIEVYLNFLFFFDTIPGSLHQARSDFLSPWTSTVPAVCVARTLPRSHVTNPSGKGAALGTSSLLQFKCIMGHWVVNSPLWTFVYSLQNEGLTRVGLHGLFPASSQLYNSMKNARYLDIIWKLPCGVEGEVQEQRSLGHIQTIKSWKQWFGCNIPLHFPKGHMMASSNSNTKPGDGPAGWEWPSLGLRHRLD